MLPYLKLCHSSIMDQNHSNYEHIIIDGNSTDGTKNWLNEKKLKHKCETDAGMYDAINKGMAMATGEIISYLNCDEQYLPRTLVTVENYFIDNPDVDIVFGHALITNPDGSLISYRKGYQPRKYYIMVSHLYVLSCTMFFRRSIMDQGYLFNTNYKDIGDMYFVLTLLQNGFKAKYIDQYLSIFTWTGNNMSTSQNAIYEMQKIKNIFPKWVKLCKIPINFLRLIEKLLSGAYLTEKPLEYEIYTQDSKDDRVSFSCSKSDFVWPK